MISINIDKAKEIVKADLRTQRKPVLEALDVAFMRAVEARDTNEQARIAVKKKMLRDATAQPSLTGASTVEQLAAVTLPNINF
jgi:hypothetical protein